MKNTWIKLTEKLPAKGELVLIKREYKGYRNTYIGTRSSNEPLTIKEDVSRDCFWHANPIDESTCGYDKLEFHYSFSDSTVIEWQPLVQTLRSDLGIKVFKDGNMWCATNFDFINIQESNAGFGETADEAIKDLLSK